NQHRSLKHPRSDLPVSNLSEYRMPLRSSKQHFPLNNTHNHRFTVEERNNHDPANLRTPTNHNRPLGIHHGHRSHRDHHYDGIPRRGSRDQCASVLSITTTHKYRTWTP